MHPWPQNYDVSTLPLCFYCSPAQSQLTTVKILTKTPYILTNFVAIVCRGASTRVWRWTLDLGMMMLVLNQCATTVSPVRPVTYNYKKLNKMDTLDSDQIFCHCLPWSQHQGLDMNPWPRNDDVSALPLCYYCSPAQSQFTTVKILIK